MLLCLWPYRNKTIYLALLLIVSYQQEDFNKYPRIVQSMKKCKKERGGKKKFKNLSTFSMQGDLDFQFLLLRYVLKVSLCNLVLSSEIYFYYQGHDSSKENRLQNSLKYVLAPSD